MEHSALDNPITASVLVLRLVIGIILVVAGIDKISNLSAFVAGVRQYAVLPVQIAHWYGRLLPIIELVTGVLLIVGAWVPLAAALATAMFTSFAVAVGVNLARKRDIPCFCFGTDAAAPLGWHTLVRSILLLFAALAIILIPPVPDLFQHDGIPFSIAMLSDLIPVGLLTIFGLLMLALVEVAPLVVRAWTARAIQPPPKALSVVWTRMDNGEEGGEVPS